MPRKKIPLDPNSIYHITARSINKEQFPIPLSEIWEIMENYLFYLNKVHQFQLYAFVLMPNHFHLLCRAPRGNMSVGMRDFMRETSRQINFRSRRINQSYGYRFHRSRIDSDNYFMNVYKYIYANPLRANLSSKAEQYPYSTLCGLVGNEKLNIPLEEDTLLFNPLFQEENLRWINTPAMKEDFDVVRKALRKSVFTLGRDRKSGRKSDQPDFLI